MASSSSSLRSKRATISITSYFCNPDLGMKDFEVLCKASVFLVKSDQAITKVNYLLMMMMMMMLLMRMTFDGDDVDIVDDMCEDVN